MKMNIRAFWALGALFASRVYVKPHQVSVAHHVLSAAQPRFETREQSLACESGDVLLIEPVQLLRIEHRVAAADAFEREQGYEFLAREQLTITARGPSEECKEVHHRFREVPEAVVLHHRRCAMTLAQSLLVGTEDQRDVREARLRRADRAIQQDLLRRVGNVIVAPHHVRDLHLHIV